METITSRGECLLILRGLSEEVNVKITMTWRESEVYHPIVSAKALAKISTIVNTIRM